MDIRADGQYVAGVGRLIGTVQKRLHVEGRTIHTLMGTSASPLQLPDVSGILPPPFEWCEIPAGKVTLTEVGGYLKEPTTFEVGRFWIAKYPITNTQFQVFTDQSDGYRKSTWWDFSNFAHDWFQQNPQPSTPALDGDYLPRTGITWFEAIAFCNWLQKQINAEIMLPSEQEWQRAAQGDDGRIYTWGNSGNITFVNTKSSGIGSITPVMQYPSGSSMFHVMDMSGNAREWCSTHWETGRNELFSYGARVLRGGSYNFEIDQAQCNSRGKTMPDRNHKGCGFRVKVSPNQS